MNKLKTVLTLAALVGSFSNAHAQGRFVKFDDVTIGDAIVLSGGGTVNQHTGLQRTGGGFRAIQDINSGPFAGLRAGEGVRWEAAETLPSSGFKCVGSDPAGMTAVTDDNTLVMQVLFFRQGDGNTASFTAKVFLSTEDENPNQPGVQNVWIQGVGCGQADVSFR